MLEAISITRWHVPGARQPGTVGVFRVLPVPFRVLYARSIWREGIYTICPPPRFFSLPDAGFRMTSITISIAD